jgi:hypothetical protein
VVEFNLSDVPIRIGDDSFILRGREDSPILKISTIGRCSDMHSTNGIRIAEGDKLLANGTDKQYVVKWINGFKAVAGDYTSAICNLKLPEVIGKASIENNTNYLYYKTGNIRWNIFDIVGYNEETGMLELNRKDLPEVSLEDIHQVFMVKSKHCALGQEVLLADGRKGTIIMKHGDIYAQVDGVRIPIETLAIK